MKSNTTKAAPKTTAPALRAAQVRILALLAKAEAPLSRAEIAEQAPCDRAGLVEWIGSDDEAKRKANDEKKGWPSLLSKGWVKAKETDAGTVYTITAAGKRAAAKAAE